MSHCAPTLTQHHPAQASQQQMGSVRAGFTGAVNSEWIKFCGLISNKVLAGVTFVLIVANAVLMPWAYVLRDRGSVQSDYDPYPEMVIDKTAYIGLILAILATLVITNEYRSGQIKTTLLATPTRTPVLAAKAVIVAGIGFVIGVVSAGIGYALAPVILARGGYSYILTTSDAVRLVLGSGLYLAVLPILGLAVGVLVRSVVGSVLVVLALMLIVPYVPQIFSAAGAIITQYFPLQAGSRLLTVIEPGSLDPWAGFGILLFWTLIVVVMAGIAYHRRDA